MALKLVQIGAISTGLVIALGLATILPAFLFPHLTVEQPVILSFDVNSEQNLPEWCNSLSDYLNEQGLKSAVFVTGKAATLHPTCISSFSNNVDIGSMTLNYQTLPEITDYLVKLEEVREGKKAVDSAGNLDSKLFKAPYGIVDDDIYSLLTRSGIMSDFSYYDHYNKFENGMFFKHDLVSYQNFEEPSEIIPKISKQDKIEPVPILISFDNSVEVSEIAKYVDLLKKENVKFVNPSEITEISLSPRNGGILP